MTVRLSNLQINVLRLFNNEHGHRAIMGLQQFATIDQRITSGLGRRKTPYLQRVGKTGFALTPEGREAVEIFERTDVFRKFASRNIAQCFETNVVSLPEKREIKRDTRRNKSRRKSSAA